MAFTDTEMAILSQLAYCGSPNSPGSTSAMNGDSLHKLIKDNESWLKSKLGDEYTAALRKLKEKTERADYSVVLCADDDKGTGFAAIAIKDPDNNVTIAARGTEGFNIFGSDASRRDVAADIELAYSISTSQQEKMEEFMKTLEKSGGYDGYYLTGHSLGGNLALYGAITFKPAEKIKGVTTFNAPGFNEAFISKYAAEIFVIYERVTNYQNEYDYVSSIMYVPGQVIIVQTSGGLLDHVGFGDHEISNMAVEGDGFLPAPYQTKGFGPVVGHIIVESLRYNTGMKGYTLLLGAIEIGINLGRTAVTAYKNITAKINGSLSGDSGTYYNSCLKVNTDSLRIYANRLTNVNKRITNLDKKMDALYKEVGLLDLLDLIEADLLTGYSSRLDKCIKYLSDTASDFESAEISISNKI